MSSGMRSPISESLPTAQSSEPSCGIRLRCGSGVPSRCFNAPTGMHMGVNSPSVAGSASCDQQTHVRDDRWVPMGLGDLTSRQAIDDAMDEFDALGRDTFLSKYGFGQAREYFMRRGNRLYDSKAIAGAAHRYQFPNQGPLKPTDFSGGEATVQRKLEELGFEVVVVHRSAKASGQGQAGGLADLEKAFDGRMLELYEAARAIGYIATRFLGMVTEHGGLHTARTLLHSPTVSDGYSALWERHRLDLTVEAAILEHRWLPLFTEDERKVAVKRLRDYGYSGDLPDH